MRRSSETGSIIYFIFIGIVLFAALGYTVTQMGGGTNPEKVKEDLAQLYAREIIDFGRSLQIATKTMRIDGVTETQVSFDTSLLSGYSNGNCSTTRCEIFSTGGGVIYTAPNAKWLDNSYSAQGTYGQWLFTGANDVTGVGTDGASASSRELLAILPWLSKTTCESINNLLGVTNPGGNPPQDNQDVDFATKFTGSYSAGDAIGGGDPEIEGQRAGCFEGGNSPPATSYHFFQVLWPR